MKYENIKRDMRRFLKETEDAYPDIDQMHIEQYFIVRNLLATFEETEDERSTQTN